MGVGDHFLILHHDHHNHHHHHQEHHHHDHGMKKDGHKTKIPKGCITVTVGQEDEEQKRFVIPVKDVNHPLFKELLKESEDEYEFNHQGPINIYCHVQDFCKVQSMIHQDQQHHHHDHHHHIFCFKE